MSREGSERLIRKAIQHCVDRDMQSVTLVHKGNIMKFTEGAFCKWGYELAKTEFGAVEKDGGPWLTFNNPRTGTEIIIKDVIADNFLQQILLRPEEYDVIATLNLNGDYISDALAAQVGGIGIAPGANIGDAVAVFEATHGTAHRDSPAKIASIPGSLILSAAMMLRYIGWGRSGRSRGQGCARTQSQMASSRSTWRGFARLFTGLSARTGHTTSRRSSTSSRTSYQARLSSAAAVSAEAVIRHMDDADE